MPRRIDLIVSEIADQYAYADTSRRPWIIGFSGGKDSTVLLTLVWNALRKLRDDAGGAPLERPVYVVCNDTMVENPIISSYVDTVLSLIEKAALDEGLPIFVRKTTPHLEDSFWVNVIGKGYPIPNTAFRWCTDKLKIKPTARFITEQVDQFGEAIILIGTRRDESATRARSIKKHEVYGSRLTRHSLLRGTYVYAPIKELMLEEVWWVINAMPCPWGFDNSVLFNIYKDASADDYECPTVVTDKSHGACGQSRFGCWVCTVVKEDKSMRALIDNGREWMRPLYDFRKWMEEGRNKPENRNSHRRDGRRAVNDMGSYTFAHRAATLLKLFETQRALQGHDASLSLITGQELIAIQVNWYRDLHFAPKVSDLYNKVYHNEINAMEEKKNDRLEAELLREVCQDNPDEAELISELLSIQKSKSLMQRRHGIKTELEQKIDEYIKKQKDEDPRD